MAANDNLVWIDLEMTGLDVERERIIECAVLVTNGDLEILAEGPELVIHQSDEQLAGMDEWNTSHHGASGLTELVRASKVDERDAEQQILRFLKKHCRARTAPLAGNSVSLDRAFLRRYMPELEAFLHYRIVDVSTIKELVRRWMPKVSDATPKKENAHRALGDIRESVAELRYYREHAFAPPGN